MRHSTLEYHLLNWITVLQLKFALLFISLCCTLSRGQHDVSLRQNVKALKLIETATIFEPSKAWSPVNWLSLGGKQEDLSEMDPTLPAIFKIVVYCFNGNRQHIISAKPRALSTAAL